MKPAVNTLPLPALSWLVKQQEPDGHWGAKKNLAEQETDISVTSLALLALFSAGHRENDGEFKDNVQRAVAWLRSKAPALDTQSSNDKSGPPLMAMALAVAVANGGNAETKAAAQKALEFCSTVYPINKDAGSGKRKPAAGANTLVVTWFALALKAAKIAHLHVEPDTFAAVTDYLDAVEHMPAGAFWSRPDEKVSPGQSAHLLSTAGTVARIALGKSGPELRASADYFLKLRGKPTSRSNEMDADLRHWYFAATALSAIDPSLFEEWDNALQRALEQRTQPDGSFGDSRENSGDAGREWGRTGLTALACLCQELHARHLQAGPVHTTVNLMELIDPRKNRTIGQGKWQIFGDHISSDSGVRGFVQIPYHPPEEYDFNVEFSMLKSRLIVLVLPGPGTQFEYGIGYGNSAAGFEMVSGKRSDENETTRPFTISANQRYKVTIKVRKTGVAAYIDDKLMAELKTDFRNLSLHHHWVIPDNRALAITNDLVVTTYHSMSVTEITGRGEIIQSKP